MGRSIHISKGGNKMKGQKELQSMNFNWTRVMKYESERLQCERQGCIVKDNLLKGIMITIVAVLKETGKRDFRMIIKRVMNLVPRPTKKQRRKKEIKKWMSWYQNKTATKKNIDKFKLSSIFIPGGCSPPKKCKNKEKNHIWTKTLNHRQ